MQQAFNQSMESTGFLIIFFENKVNELGDPKTYQNTKMETAIK